MLFLSRAWLEDLSELFLVRKADFLKLKILSEKLVLEREKKKNHNNTHTQQNHPDILQGKRHTEVIPQQKEILPL